MMNLTLKQTVKAFCVACTALASMPSHAELSFPTEPPSAQQVQQPSDKDTIVGAAVPVILEQNTAGKDKKGAENIQQVRKLVTQALGKQNVVVLPLAIEAAEKPASASEARNIATAPIQAQLAIQLEIATLEKPLIGADYIPVTVQLKDAEGKVIKTETLEYRSAESALFITAIEQMLATHTEPLPVTKIAQPQLKTWIETKDGKPVKTGSGLAIYFQPDTKGYVSLYHFDSAKSVQRLYPSKHEPVNFVQPGVTYRYPQKGYLDVKGKIGEETIKAVFTRWSSNMPRVVDGLKSKTASLNIIPTHYPMLFATGDMTRFFALPKTHYTESHLHYTITK